MGRVDDSVFIKHPFNPEARIEDDGSRVRVYDKDGRLLGWIDKALFFNVISIVERVASERMAGLIVIDGPVGSGKTSQAVQLADAVSGYRIDLNERLVMSGHELMKQAVRIADGKTVKVMVYDEAGDFSNRGFLDKFNKTLMRFWEQHRALKTPIILTLPNALLLDRGIYDLRLPRMFIHILKKVDGVKADSAVYSLGRFLYVKNYAKRMVIPESAYKYVQPNFYAVLNPLPVDRQRELDRISLKRKKDNLAAGTLKAQGYRTVDELAYEFGVSPRTVRSYAGKLGLQPEIVHQKRRYYRPEDVERLRVLLRDRKKK